MRRHPAVRPDRTRKRSPARSPGWWGLLLACLLYAAPLAAQRPAFEATSTDPLRWFKGNTHTHTTESDGDSPPELVARWYKDHGYDFLVLSDHNVFTDPRTLAHLVDSTFLLIPGEEVTAAFQRKPVHVNGLNIPGLIEPRSDSTLLGTIQKNVDAVREVAGVPHINHPNFQWAFDHEVLKHVRNDRLLEIFNGHPHVHNHGAGGRPGMEAIWDTLLTGGKRMYGIAVDDAHHFQEYGRDLANPGRGWVAVKARALDAAALMESLEQGLFYASSGVELDDVIVSPSRIEILVRRRGDFTYTTQFIGSGGRVLAETFGERAVFDLPPLDEIARPGEAPYVRARVVDSGGAVAWVQPVFVRVP